MKPRGKLLLACTTAALLVSSAVLSASAAERHRSKGAESPLVGTWVLDVNRDTTDDPPALLTIEAGGTLRLTDCCNGAAAGAWEAHGARNATATLLSPSYDEDGFVGFNTIRARVAVSSEDDALSAFYTMDIPARDGTTTGQVGPVQATGVRLAVEPMGDPVGPLPVAEPEAMPPSTPIPAPATPAPEPTPEPTD